MEISLISYPKKDILENKDQALNTAFTVIFGTSSETSVCPRNTYVSKAIC